MRRRHSRVMPDGGVESVRVAIVDHRDFSIVTIDLGRPNLRPGKPQTKQRSQYAGQYRQFTHAFVLHSVSARFAFDSSPRTARRYSDGYRHSLPTPSSGSHTNGGRLVHPAAAGLLSDVVATAFLR